MKIVTNNSNIRVSMILIPIVLIAACSSPSKGACVRGTGITATCGDGFTAANCAQFAGGDSFHEGRSCADLGFTSG